MINVNEGGFDTADEDQGDKILLQKDDVGESKSSASAKSNDFIFFKIKWNTRKIPLMLIMTRQMKWLLALKIIGILIPMKKKVKKNFMTKK